MRRQRRRDLAADRVIGVGLLKQEFLALVRRPLQRSLTAPESAPNSPV
jgi:hypothetical protein